MTRRRSDDLRSIDPSFRDEFVHLEELEVVERRERGARQLVARLATTHAELHYQYAL